MKLLISAMVWPVVGAPVLTFADEESFDAPLAEVARRLADEAPAGSLVLVDVIDVPDGTDAGSCAHAAMTHARANDQRWKNAAMLFRYDLDHLRLVRRGGTLAGNIPAPELSQDDVRAVLQAIRRDATWNGQTVVAYSQDGAMVRLGSDGAVSIVPGALPPHRS